MQAGEFLLLGLGQIQIGEPAPHGNGPLHDQRVAQLAPPAHEARQADTGNAVGHQKVKVFLQH
jgi:hypothetical protein